MLCRALRSESRDEWGFKWELILDGGKLNVGKSPASRPSLLFSPHCDTKAACWKVSFHLISTHFSSRSTAHRWERCMRQPGASHFSPIVFFPPLFQLRLSARLAQMCLTHKWRMKSTFTACELDFQFKALLETSHAVINQKMRKLN